MNEIIEEKILKMCTNPITITRNYPLIGIKSFTVPCGKCAECIAKKQSELAALCAHQAQVSGSLHFFTLTYRNERLPIAYFDSKVDCIVGFGRGCSPWLDSSGVFSSSLKVFSADGLYHDCSNTLDYPDSVFAVPSLCREDIKKWLKLFRTRWKRFSGVPLSFKYCIFGEIGDLHGRPHYHGLFFGLSQEQAEFAAKIWKEVNGFTYVAPDRYRALSSSEIEAVSCYTSKYVSKGISSRFSHLLRYMEKPRRQSSLDFGQFSDSELAALARFIMGAICTYSMGPDLDFLHLTNFLALLLEDNLLPLTEKVMLYHNL